jgi:hypothetical protein
MAKPAPTTSSTSQELVVELKYTCEDLANPTTDITPITIFCNEAGVQVPPPGEEAPLPVTFSSFNVNREILHPATVSWTTASEQNNRGFNVQRNDGKGWKTVAFVFSKSVAGTSSGELSYEYNDANMERGVSQYRIQQLDLDGRFAFSMIRTIRGEGVSAKTLIYPNPSSNGKVNVVFENPNGLQDVQVSDAAGRVVKQFKGVTNNVVIENLRSGFYSIKIINRTTAKSSVEKVVIK